MFSRFRQSARRSRSRANFSDEGEKIVRGEDRLRALQMGITGQDQVAVPLGGGDVGGLQGDEAGVDPVERVAGPELDVGGDLVVPAPSGMELPADVADPLDERRLDVHVDVFAFEREREVPRLDLVANRGQPARDLPALVGGDQTDRGEHRRVGDRPPDVVLEEPTVKRDRLAELFDATVGPPVEPSPPRLVGHPRITPSFKSPMLSPKARRRDFKALAAWLSIRVGPSASMSLDGRCESRSKFRSDSVIGPPLVLSDHFGVVATLEVEPTQE